MSDPDRFEIIDISDEAAFASLPPCADPRFDHRSCNYWEDEVRGSKAARPSWWQEAAPRPAPRDSPAGSRDPFSSGRDAEDAFNPFAPKAMAAALDPLAGADPSATSSFNPFAPQPPAPDEASRGPRKLRLLARGRSVFGPYGKILLLDSEPAGYAQFGPLSAYPRAQHIRELYPRLPQSPLPAVITCVSTAPTARGQGIGRRLVEAVCVDLAARGFAAIEAYPDLTLAADEASASHPDFWIGCAFVMAIDDERYPVMRRPLL
ncbi:MAG: N-acetyltransferase family protein [Chloroflexota bacterium]